MAKKLTIKEVEKRVLESSNGLVVLDTATYKNISTKATFFDKDYGEWESLPNSVLAGHLNYKRGSLKRQNTNLLKYGVPFISQNNEIALKQTKGNKKISIKKHWKTNEDLVCQASYEAKVVDYLNANKIDFLWQPKTFKMPNNKTYRPDLFLLDCNKWVEIKGYMRKHSLLKWDLFKTQFPMAELWNTPKLKEMGIL